MQIVVNHLTRMKKGFCAAGIDVDSGSHVRPLLPKQQLPFSLLESEGGAFGIGARLDLGSVRPTPRCPEIEDHIFDVRKVRQVGHVEKSSFKSLIRSAAKPDLKSVFGPELESIGGHSGGVPEGHGSCSLGCVSLAKPPRLICKKFKDGTYHIRLQYADPGLGFLDLSVTDIRLYGKDHVTPDRPTISKLRESLKRCERVILSMGLSRAYSSSKKYTPMHWLQINNIHLDCR